MRAKNVKDEPGQSIIASIVKDALKRPQKGHKRHKIHNAVIFLYQDPNRTKGWKGVGRIIVGKNQMFHRHQCNNKEVTGQHDGRLDKTS